MEKSTDILGKHLTKKEVKRFIYLSAQINNRKNKKGENIELLIEQRSIIVQKFKKGLQEDKKREKQARKLQEKENKFPFFKKAFALFSKK